MKKVWIALLITLVPAIAKPEQKKLVPNPFTGKLDYITRIDSNTPIVASTISATTFAGSAASMTDTVSFYDEGTFQGRGSSVNITGTGATLTFSGQRATINIPGSAGVSGGSGGFYFTIEGVVVSTVNAPGLAYTADGGSVTFQIPSSSFTWIAPQTHNSSTTFNKPATFITTASATSPIVSVVSSQTLSGVLQTLNSGLINVKMGTNTTEGLVIYSSVPSNQAGAAMLLLLNNGPLWNDPYFRIIGVSTTSGPQIRIDAPNPNIELVGSSDVTHGLSSGEIGFGYLSEELGFNMRSWDNLTYEAGMALRPRSKQGALVLYPTVAGIRGAPGTSTTTFRLIWLSTDSLHEVWLDGPLFSTASFGWKLSNKFFEVGQPFFNAGGSPSRLMDLMTGGVTGDFMMRNGLTGPIWFDFKTPVAADTTTLKNRLDSVAVDTTTLGSSTNTLSGRLDAVAVDTTTLSLSTNTLKTRLGAVGVDTTTLRGDFNASTNTFSGRIIGFDEGVAVTTITAINFVGAGISAAAAAGVSTLTVTVSGSAGADFANFPKSGATNYIQNSSVLQAGSTVYVSSVNAGIINFSSAIVFIGHLTSTNPFVWAWTNSTGTTLTITIYGNAQSTFTNMPVLGSSSDTVVFALNGSTYSSFEMRNNALVFRTTTTPLALLDPAYGRIFISTDTDIYLQLPDGRLKSLTLDTQGAGTVNLQVYQDTGTLRAESAIATTTLKNRLDAVAIDTTTFSVSTNTLRLRLDAVAIDTTTLSNSTNTLKTRLNAVAVDTTTLSLSTNTLKGRLDAVAIDTTTLSLSTTTLSGRLDAVGVDTTTLSLSTNTLRTRLNAVGVDTTTLRTDLNTSTNTFSVRIIGFDEGTAVTTITAINFVGAGIAATAGAGISTLTVTVSGSAGSDFANLPKSGATNYIQNTDTLQSGSTFYVSSGTVNGNAVVIGSMSVMNTITSTGGIIVNSSSFTSINVSSNVTMPYDTTRSGNVFTSTVAWTLKFPSASSATANIINTFSTSAAYGQGQYEANTSSALGFNCFRYDETMPGNSDPNLTPLMTLFSVISSTPDKASSLYVMSVSSYGNDGNYRTVATTFPVVVKIGSDFVSTSTESARTSTNTVTLTNWNTLLVPNQSTDLVIQVCRDGNNALDASQVYSWTKRIETVWGIKQ